MNRLNNILIFLTVFFSMAIIFRVNLFGITISYSQITGFLLIIPFLSLNLNGGMKLSKSALEYLLLSLSFVIFSMLSIIFLVKYSSDSLNQYFKGVVSLAGNFFITTLIVLFVVKNEKNKDFFLWCFIYSLKILMIYGIVQMLFYMLKYDLNSHLVEYLNLDVPYASNLFGRYLRVSSLLWDANFFGFLMLLYIMLYYQFKETKLFFHRQAFFTVIAFILILFTFSRSAILGLLIFIILNMKRKIPVKVFNRIVLYGIFTLSSLIYIYLKFTYIFEPIIQSRFGFLISKKYITSSTTLRESYWEKGMRILAEHPFGIGLNNYSQYALVNLGDSFNKLHSSFLQLSVETGFLTAFIHYFFLYFFIIKKSTYLSLQYRWAMFLSIFAISLVYDQTLYLFMYLFLIINITPLANKNE